MVVVFAIVVLVIVLFVTEALPIDTVAIGVLVTLVALEPWTGVSPADGLSGFANAATITVLAMFVLSEGIRRTGLIRRVGAAVSRLTGGDSRKVLLAVLCLGGHQPASSTTRRSWRCSSRWSTTWPTSTASRRRSS